MRHRGGMTVIQVVGGTWEAEVGMPKENAESDEQGRNVPKFASVADCPVVA